VLRKVVHADMSGATSCPDFTVAQLADHLLESIVHLGTMAGAEVAIPADGSVEQRIAPAIQQSIEAWRIRGIDGMVSIGESQMPASIAINILSVELLVHAWDLAEATSQDVHVPEALAAYVLELSREIMAPEARSSRFDPELEAAPEADSLHRLLAFTGRKA
jgi:uncharacterized protein (TIGR03086 family)